MDIEILKRIEETEEWKQLNQYYRQKLEVAIESLGEKWILHPTNQQHKEKR
jgi:hypothetical protein